MEVCWPLVHRYLTYNYFLSIYLLFSQLKSVSPSRQALAFLSLTPGTSLDTKTAHNTKTKQELLFLFSRRKHWVWKGENVSGLEGLSFERPFPFSLESKGQWPESLEKEKRVLRLSYPNSDWAKDILSMLYVHLSSANLTPITSDIVSWPYEVFLHSFGIPLNPFGLSDTRQVFMNETEKNCARITWLIRVYIYIYFFFPYATISPFY